MAVFSDSYVFAAGGDRRTSTTSWIVSGSRLAMTRLNLALSPWTRWTWKAASTWKNHRSGFARQNGGRRQFATASIAIAGGAANPGPMPPGGGARLLADGLPGGVRIVSGIVLLKKNPLRRRNKGPPCGTWLRYEKKDGGRTRKA